MKCINKATGESVDGCHFNTHLKPGPKNGGHEHDYDSRPLGQVYIDETLPIPANGLEFTYLASEISGDIDLSVFGTGPNGETASPAFLRIDLRAGDFQQINVPYLTFNVQSHPLGIYGTGELNRRLESAISKFRNLVDALGIQPIPVLESESASLPMGGLFDIDYAKDFPWTPPRCSHRDGRRIDLSLSVFEKFSTNDKKLLLDKLQLSLKRSGLTPSIEGDHWHVGF